MQITADTLIVFRERTMRFETFADEVLPPLMGSFAITDLGRRLERDGRARNLDVYVRLAKPSEIKEFPTAHAPN